MGGHPVLEAGSSDPHTQTGVRDAGSLIFRNSDSFRMRGCA